MILINSIRQGVMLSDCVTQEIDPERLCEAGG